MASSRKKAVPVHTSAALRMLVLGLGVVALPCAPGHAEALGVPALVVKAKRACFSSTAHFTGLVVPRAEAIVNLNIDGYQIDDVLVAEGDAVTSGQVLARLVRLSGSSATGAAGTSTGGGTPAQQPATLALRAPASGVVARSNAKVGQVAAAVPLPPPLGPEPLFRIIVGNELEVEAEVPSFHLPKLQVGQLARIQLDNGHDVTSQVRTVFPVIDRNTQLGKVRLTVGSDPTIRAGMFARGTIDASHSCGVSIPRSAVTYRTEGTTVQIVRDNTVETRSVKVGFFSETDIEVGEGVKEGDLVIANAGASLRDGDRINPMIADELSQLKAR
jgi:HlyD family secretion protein